jgi:RHS repeat-associated protein
VTGPFFYTRDHLGSIRELTDGSGDMRSRYAYDPYGRRTKFAGDLEIDFGFAGMFFSGEVGLAITRFRSYDPELGRWLSRDPLTLAEVEEGPNLYAYVGNDPVNRVDPLGLSGCCDKERDELGAAGMDAIRNQQACENAQRLAQAVCAGKNRKLCAQAKGTAYDACWRRLHTAEKNLRDCQARMKCPPDPPPSPYCGGRGRND